MASSPTAKYSTVTFPTPEVAWQAFRGTSQPFYGYKVLVEAARKLGEPYLATVTFKKPAVETDITNMEDDDDEDKSMSTRRKRVKTNINQPGWHVWRSGEAEQRSKEQTAAKTNLHHSTHVTIPVNDVSGTDLPPPASGERVTYHIENLQKGVTASHLKSFLEKRNM